MNRSLYVIAWLKDILVSSWRNRFCETTRSPMTACRHPRSYHSRIRRTSTRIKQSTMMTEMRPLDIMQCRMACMTILTACLYLFFLRIILITDSDVTFAIEETRHQPSGRYEQDDSAVISYWNNDSIFYDPLYRMSDSMNSLHSVSAYVSKDLDKYSVTAPRDAALHAMVISPYSPLRGLLMSTQSRIELSPQDSSTIDVSVQAETNTPPSAQ